MADRRFTFFESFYQVARLMDDAERLAFLDALIAYGIEGAEPDGLAGSALVGFTLAKPTLEKSRRRAQTSADNGRKGGRPRKKPNANLADSQAEPGETQAEKAETKGEPGEDDRLPLGIPDIDKDIDIDKDKDVDTDIDKPKGAGERPTRTRPHRPSEEEWWARWKEVADQRGVPPSRYEAERAYAYYDSNGWKQNNGNPIKRWKGALMTCFFQAHPELKDRDRGGVADDPFGAYRGS